MGLWSKLMGGAAKAARKPPPVRTTMGIAGHGMILAPACPCRVVPIEELLIIGRGYTGTLLTEAVIKLGTAPATEPPKRIADRVHVEPDRPSDHVYALGPSGPTITFEGVGPKLTEMFARIDAGLALGPDSWTVLAPGFMFAIPTPGFVVCSPDPDVEGDLPSVMLAMKTSAQITFARSSRRVDMIEVTSGATALPSEEVELAGGVCRRWERKYDHDDAAWIQHTYGLGLAENLTIMMMVQAPAAIWLQLHDAAMTIANSFEPLSL